MGSDGSYGSRGGGGLLVEAGAALVFFEVSSRLLGSNAFTTEASGGHASMVRWLPGLCTMEMDERAGAQEPSALWYACHGGHALTFLRCFWRRALTQFSTVTATTILLWKPLALLGAGSSLEVSEVGSSS